MYKMKTENVHGDFSKKKNCLILVIILVMKIQTHLLLINYLKMIRFNENESKVLISKLEIESVSGTVKLAKRF